MHKLLFVIFTRNHSSLPKLHCFISTKYLTKTNGQMVILTTLVVSVSWGPRQIDNKFFAFHLKMAPSCISNLLRTFISFYNNLNIEILQKKHPLKSFHTFVHFSSLLYDLELLFAVYHVASFYYFLFLTISSTCPFVLIFSSFMDVTFFGSLFQASQKPNIHFSNNRNYVRF